MDKRAYTEEERRAIAKAYEDGDVVKDIAERFHCPEPSVYYIAKQMGCVSNRGLRGRNGRTAVLARIKKQPEEVQKLARAVLRARNKPKSSFIPPKRETLSEMYPGLVGDCYDNRGNIPYWLAKLQHGYNVMSRDAAGEFAVRVNNIRSLKDALAFWQWHVKLFDSALCGEGDNK